MTLTLTGRIALVTGGGRGIGRAIAQVLAERGAHVVVNDLHGDRSTGTAEEIAAAGGRASALAFDVTDFDVVGDALTQVERDQGPVDILVNNAGIPEGRWTGRFVASSPADWRPYVDLNVYGPMNCLRWVLPGMCDRGWGRVIQISSAAAARALPAGAGESLYAATKAAMDSLVRQVSVEVAREGVTCNAVAPGVMDAAKAYADPAVIESVVERVPMGRLGASREVAEAVAWLASDSAAFVTGQVVHVNGGSYQGR